MRNCNCSGPAVCPPRPYPVRCVRTGNVIPATWDRKTGFCCRTCQSCAPTDETMGRCRRHAPTLQGYPVVYLDSDWCGDHKLGTNPSKEAAK